MQRFSLFLDLNIENTSPVQKFSILKGAETGVQPQITNVCIAKLNLNIQKFYREPLLKP
jgi:hypothetical protein